MIFLHSATPFNESSPSEAPAVPDIQIAINPNQDAETQLDPPTKVLLHNDDLTPYDFVVNVMRAVFEFSWTDAVAVTETAHFKGIALVGVYPLEEAKYKVGQAHALARAEGYPLTLTIEAEEG
jgi:ATP-dependent Clp protease adaptor protein ClpS